MPAADSRTVGQAVADAIAEPLTALATLVAARALAEGDDQAAEEYATALELAQALDAWNAERRMQVALEALDAETDTTRMVGDLSVGQRYRVRLACLLGADADFLLLDEPPNHLDNSGLDFLTTQLRARNGGVVFVSHDRALLADVAETIIDLDPTPDGRPRVYGNGYAGYREGSLAERERWEHEYEREQATLARMQDSLSAAQNLLVSRWRPQKGGYLRNTSTADANDAHFYAKVSGFGWAHLALGQSRHGTHVSKVVYDPGATRMSISRAQVCRDRTFLGPGLLACRCLRAESRWLERALTSSPWRDVAKPLRCNGFGDYAPSVFPVTDARFAGCSGHCWRTMDLMGRGVFPGDDAARRAASWVMADRVRLFGSTAVASLVATGICLLVPHWFFSAVLGTILALLTAALGLLTLATWWASREGATDPSDVWDSPEDDGDELEEVFRGFQVYREDQHPSP